MLPELVIFILFALQTLFISCNAVIYEEFQVLLGSYHTLDKEIYEIEKGEIPATDDELTHKRKDRVFLKDEIYTFLQKN